MAFKVRKDDGYHCFWCKALVAEDASVCPKCGREFALPPGDEPAASATRAMADRGPDPALDLPRRTGSGLAVSMIVAGVIIVILGLILTNELRQHYPGGRYPDEWSEALYYIGVLGVILGLIAAALGIYHTITSASARARIPTARRCLNCSRPLQADYRFCPDCGTRVKQDTD